jgi:hypothetical protein
MSLMRRSLTAQSRGQVMVLGAVALMVMALMLMASFSVSNAIHEKIRIQSHADAEAYSVAVFEARALNVTTHYNRAIAATLVAQMSLHSWMAIATANVAQLEGEMISLFMIAADEASQGCYPYVFTHCICMFTALANAAAVYMELLDWVDKLQGHDDEFNDAVKAFKEMADSLHASQNKVLDRMWNEFDTGTTMLSTLKEKNAAASAYAGNMPKMNRSSFACALEGSSHDDDCEAKDRPKADTEDRSKVMQNAANAARPNFDTRSSGPDISHQNWDMGSGDVPTDQLWNGEWKLLTETTTAGVAKGKDAPSAGDEGNDVGAQMPMLGGANKVSNYLHAKPATGFFSADIFSDTNGGEHKSTFALNDNDHSEFKGVQLEDPCQESNCFVNFRANTNADQDYGQPTVYGAVSQSLRKYHLKNQAGFADHPGWEINNDGQVKVKLVQGEDPAVINYVARHDGYAVAKAKVYFHQLGNWAAPPNFFDPFWRAKLHFFNRSEMEAVLKDIGDEDGTKMLPGAPVEGEL